MTIQVPELFYDGGCAYQLLSYPLDLIIIDSTVKIKSSTFYDFYNLCELSGSSRRVIPKEKLDRLCNGKWVSSCWRGYQCHWTLESDKLILTKITCPYDESNIIFQLFEAEKVFADWVDGILIYSSDAVLELKKDSEWVSTGTSLEFNENGYVLLSFKSGVLQNREEAKTTEDLFSFWKRYQ